MQGRWFVNELKVCPAKGRHTLPLNIRLNRRARCAPASTRTSLRSVRKRRTAETSSVRLAADSLEKSTPGSERQLLLWQWYRGVWGVG